MTTRLKNDCVKCECCLSSNLLTKAAHGIPRVVIKQQDICVGDTGLLPLETKQTRRRQSEDVVRNTGAPKEWHGRLSCALSECSPVRSHVHTAAMVRLLHFADQQICGGVRKGGLITGRIQEEE